ncbi:MAG: hypothetical protein ACYDG5_01865 [Dehalococcoidales bacterium]
MLCIWRVIKTLPRKLNWLLGQKYWNGLGVLITIGIAVMIFIISQNWQEARYEESIANIEVTWVDIINPVKVVLSENDTNSFTKFTVDPAFWGATDVYGLPQSNRWLVLLHFMNSGPAPASKFVISLSYGGEGIKPVSLPKIIDFDMRAKIGGGSMISVRDKPEGIFSYEATADITFENLFIDSGFFVLLDFYVDDEINEMLINDSMYRHVSWFISNTKIVGYTISDLGWEPDYGIFGHDLPKFVKHISLTGQYIRQTWEWNYPGLFKYR